MNIIKKIALLLAIVFSYCQSVTAQEPKLKVTWDNGSKEVYSDQCKVEFYDIGLLPAVKTNLTFQFGENEKENDYIFKENYCFVNEYENAKYTYMVDPGYYYVKVKYVTGYATPYFHVVISQHTTHTIGDTDKPTEPTCTTKGFPGKCSECGQWIWDTSTTTTSTDYKPVLGHDFTDQTWTTDEVNGGKYRTCTNSGCDHKQYTYDVVSGEPALSITLKDGETLTYPQSKSPVYAWDGMMWKVKLGETTACELSQEQVNGILTQWPHNNTDHQCADKSWVDGCSVEGCAEGRTQRWVNINGNKVETTAITGDLAIASLTLDDAEGYECEAEYTANAVSYGRTMTNQWGTLCLPFEIKSDQYATCKFYELKEVKETEIVLTEVTGNIPAGTPVLVRRNTEGTNISLNATNAAITVAPAASSSANGFSLVGRFTASGALPADSYIISNNKFWRVSDLTSDVTDVKVGPFRAYLQSNGVQNVRMMSLSIGDDDTTAIDVLNAADEGEAEIYDLNGHRLQGLQKGMNIVKRGNKTTKVIIK